MRRVIGEIEPQLCKNLIENTNKEIQNFNSECGFYLKFKNKVPVGQPSSYFIQFYFK